ncbi:CAP domain-containing protein [Staphylococcus simulans]|uniref:CAP domain-containing protein n=1 Tax=Staphylococcus simulans TaxID=1286 RepID=UPI001F1A6A1C|nr:CAP domain-containing protein [Staphylococcus simulans]
MKRVFGFSFVFLLLALCIPIKETSFMIDIQNQTKAKVQALAANESISKEPLKVPDKQDFAFRNIQMNMSQSEVEQQLGKPERVTSNEYGLKWYAYHDDYQSFVMVSYIDGKVNGIYSNQNVISSKSKIKYGSPKTAVRSRLGDPITSMTKGNYKYQIESDEYDTFDKDGIYTTVFYDKHENNQVTGIMQISKEMENRLTKQYGAPSTSLTYGFEMQNFDLVNAERVQKGLSVLKYSDAISNTARKHSKDMADHHYFDHTNPKGESPFDRMKKDGIDYNSAGENLAYGHQNSIFAHEGLMNSEGHRKNILQSGFKNLGVGVDFNEDRQPFWTENYTS